MFNFEKVVKKPIVLEAVQLTSTVWEKVYTNSNHREMINDYYLEAGFITEEYLYPDNDSPSGVTPVEEQKKCFFVNTLEDVEVGRLHKAKVDDWLIVGIAGEIYACDKEIFEKTYNILKETK